MTIYCIDCHILIWGVRKQCTDGRIHLIKRAEHFLNQCVEDKSQILVPSIVAAEFMAQCSLPEMARFSSGAKELFQIANFDLPSAQIFAELFQRYQYDNPAWNAQIGQEGRRLKMKLDFMIVATALAHQATCIVSEDAGDIKKFAMGKIPVVQLPEAGRQSEMKL